MDTARDKDTLDFVEAEDLWDMTTVDREGYICRGCAIQAFPASFDKEKNKKRPYFSLGPVGKHYPGCDVDGEEKIVKRASKERVGTPEGFPLPFPNRLILSDVRPVVQGAAAQTREQAEGVTASRARSGDAPKRHHGHTVKTIRPACSAFIKFPNDREHLPLAIEDVPGDTYAKIFLYLGSKKPEYFKTPWHLYYAAIRWTAEPIITETHCELILNAGEWDTTKNTYRSFSRVRVDWSSWSTSRRDTLMREYEATRLEAAEKFKTDRQSKGWIFFVGDQDANDPSVFIVDNRRLICCLSARMVWPSRR